MRRAGLFALLFALGCTHRGAPDRAPAGARFVRAVPSSVCRQLGSSYNPCYPTGAELSGLSIDPCRELRQGRCTPSFGPMCLLDPIADGRPCNHGRGTCRDGRCACTDPKMCGMECRAPCPVP